MACEMSLKWKIISYLENKFKRNYTKRSENYYLYYVEGKNPTFYDYETGEKHV